MLSVIVILSEDWEVFYWYYLHSGDHSNWSNACNVLDGISFALSKALQGIYLFFHGLHFAGAETEAQST